jgi:hypothetical protein
MKNYISFFEPRKFQVVYVPRNEDWEYSKLYLNINKQYLRFLNTKNLFASAVAWFIFLKQAFFMAVWILMLFFILSHNKKLAKRLHLLIPVIVYWAMTENEVKYFLERNSQFAKQNRQEVVSKSKIVETYVDEKSDDIMSTIESEEVWKSFKEFIAKEKVEKQAQEKKDTAFEKIFTKDTSQTPAKSIFDDYESVMDKFNKK